MCGLFFFYEVNPLSQRVFSCVSTRPPSDYPNAKDESAIVARKPMKALKGKMLLYSSTDFKVRRWIPVDEILENVKNKQGTVVDTDLLLLTRNKHETEEIDPDDAVGCGHHQCCRSSSSTLPSQKSTHRRTTTMMIVLVLTAILAHIWANDVGWREALVRASELQLPSMDKIRDTCSHLCAMVTGFGR